MTRRDAHLGPNKLQALASLQKATPTAVAAVENGSERTTSQVIEQ